MRPKNHEPYVRARLIALELNATLKKSVADILIQLNAANADVKWVNPKNIHWTLKFLGNISPSQIETVKKILKELGLTWLLQFPLLLTHSILFRGTQVCS